MLVLIFNKMTHIHTLVHTWQTHMRGHSIRLFDLFYMIDKSGDGLIDREELRDALEEIYSPGIPLSQVCACVV